MPEAKTTGAGMPGRRFKPYPAYKDSGVEWLGEIPAHWDARRLKVVSTVIMGQSPQSEHYNMSGDGLPFLQGNADFGTEHPEPRVFCPVAPKTVKPGDHLISVRAPVGALNTADQDYGIGRGLCAVRILPPLVDNRFARWSLAVSSRGLDTVAVGSTYEAVSAEDVAGLTMPLPQDTEQRAIAEFLDRETARIDALVAKKKRLIELLQEKRTALITRAVTKGLDPNAPMKDSGVEWLGEIPAHWEVRRLRDLSPSLGVGVVVNPSQYMADDGLPFLYGSDIGEGRILAKQARRISPEDSRRLPKSQLHAGDLVMVRVGAPGVTAVVPLELEGANCASILVIRGGPRFDSRWLCYALNSRPVRSQVEIVQYGAAQEQFNVSHAVNFLVGVPRVPEQQHIAAFLDQETARIDALVAKVRDAIDRLKELRTALISAAVTGKIDVREAATA
jgi:type I restriction enzyme S subunit